MYTHNIFTMGIIYRIVSPNGKKYVGQTIKTLEHRTRQHMNAAKREADEKCCRVINRAIRKYGWDNMICEIITECDDAELNELEILMIEEENSLYPNGYNLSRGGAGCVYTQTDIIKEKRSKSLRIRPDTMNLPMYVKFRKTKFSEGFIYEKPGCKAIQYTSPKLSMEQKRLLMVEHIELLNDNPDLIVDVKRTFRFPFEIAKYISYQNRISGFVVNKPGYSRRTFSDKFSSDEEKYDKAKEYLDTLI